MPEVPTPIKIAIGIAATAADELKKLPATLPGTLAEVPVAAVSTAMQTSMKVQQRLAALIARGDEVISQLRGAPDEPPAWATFDDPPATDATPLRAAFDRIDYDATGYAEGDDGPGRWDAVGAGSDDADTDADADADGASEVLDGAAPVPAASRGKAAARTAPAKTTPAQKAPAKKSSAKTTPAQKAPAQKPPTAKPPAKKAPAKKSAAKKSPAKAPATPSQPALRTSVHEVESAELPAAGLDTTAKRAGAVKAGATSTPAAKAARRSPRAAKATASLVEDLRSAAKDFDVEP